MKFCTQCGGQMEDNTSVCPYCGSVEETEENAVQTNAPVNAGFVTMPSAPGVEIDGAKIKKYTFLILSILMTVIIFCLYMFVGFANINEGAKYSHSTSYRATVWNDEETWVKVKEDRYGEVYDYTSRSLTNYLINFYKESIEKYEYYNEKYEADVEKGHEKLESDYFIPVRYVKYTMLFTSALVAAHILVIIFGILWFVSLCSLRPGKSLKKIYRSTSRLSTVILLVLAGYFAYIAFVNRVLFTGFGIIPSAGYYVLLVFAIAQRFAVLPQLKRAIKKK